MRHHRSYVAVVPRMGGLVNQQGLEDCDCLVPGVLVVCPLRVLGVTPRLRQSLAIVQFRSVSP